MQETFLRQGSGNVIKILQVTQEEKNYYFYMCEIATFQNLFAEIRLIPNFRR